MPEFACLNPFMNQVYFYGYAKIRKRSIDFYES